MNKMFKTECQTPLSEMVSLMRMSQSIVFSTDNRRRHHVEEFTLFCFIIRHRHF